MLKLSINFAIYATVATALWSINGLSYANGDVLAEALWVDSQDKSQRLQFAQLINDEWQDESTIYETDNAMTSLALGTGLAGEKIVIWTEQKRLKTALMFMKASIVNGSLKWSEASIFSQKGHENFSASIVYDSAGTAWVFWASTRNDFSDIVLKKYDGSWSEPEQVHSKNQVPDIKPRASIAHSGGVTVEWKSYDFEVGDYVSRSRLFSSLIKADGEPEISLVDKVVPSDVQLPSNMYTGAQVLLHFPSNQLIQSVRYSNGSASN